MFSLKLFLAIAVATTTVTVAGYLYQRSRNAPKSQQNNRIFECAKSPALLEDLRRMLASVSAAQLAKLRNSEGDSILAVAAKHGNVSAVRVLLGIQNCQLLLETKDRRGISIQHGLIEQNNISLLKQMLSQPILAFAQLSLTTIRDNSSLLHYAARFNNPDACTFLLKLHADVNARDKDGRDALMIANLCFSTNVAHTLISNASSIESLSTIDFGNKSALFYACQNGLVDVLKAMLNKMDQLMLEYTQKQDQKPKNAISSRTSLNSIRRARTASHSSLGSISSGGKHVPSEPPTDVRNLVEEDSAFGFTPLLVACLHGNFEVVDELVKYGGFDSSLKTKTNQTWLQLAVQSGNIKLVEYILEHCATSKDSVDEFLRTCDAMGNSLLHTAAHFNHPEIISLLCAKGASFQLTSVNNLGQTVLHSALIPPYTSYWDPHVQRSVFTETTCFFERNIELRRTFRVHLLETVKILERLNAIPANHTDKYGLTPMAVYIKYPVSDAEGHLNIRRLLQSATVRSEENTLKQSARRFEPRSMSLQEIAASVMDGMKPPRICTILGSRASIRTGFIRPRVPRTRESVSEFYAAMNAARKVAKSPAHLDDSHSFSTPLSHVFAVSAETVGLENGGDAGWVFDAGVGNAGEKGHVVEVVPGVVSMYGSFGRLGCLVCGEMQEDADGTDRFPVGEGRKKEKPMGSFGSVDEEWVRCNRIGCVDGFIGPRILYDGEDCEEWVRREFRGWKGTAFEGLDICGLVIIVGLDSGDGIISRVIAKVPESVTILVIDDHEVDFLDDTLFLHPVTRIIVDRENGGIEEGLKRVARAFGWNFPGNFASK